MTGKAVWAVAADSESNLYVAFAFEDGIHKLSPSGTLLQNLVVEQPQNLAVDAANNLYVVVFRPSWEVLEFGPSGEDILPSGSDFAGPEGHGTLGGIAVNTVTGAGASDIYVTDDIQGSRSALRAFGPTPDKWPLPNRAPEITAQFAVEVEAQGATLKAQINPHLWADARYYVQYGTGICSEGGCAANLPAPPGSPLGHGTDFATATAPVIIDNLAPSTTYHYRFIAQSGGGGPVRGVGPGEAEGTFTTPPLSSQDAGACPNQIFREGPSARLADCRAYEMVSPVDKNNSDIVSLVSIASDPASYQQSSLTGEKLTYSAYRAFGDSDGAPYTSQYIASRGTGGWLTHSISPPQGASQFPIGRTAESQFRSFSPDLCSSTLLQFSDRMLAPGAAENYPNIYRRQNCGTEGYEAVTTVTPAIVSGNFPDVQGVSADGACTVFRAAEKLTADAHEYVAPTTFQVYESCGGTPRLVSALPTGEAAFQGLAGTGPGAGSGFAMRRINVKNAVSEDGKKVYWTAALATGALYLRRNADQPPSAVVGGECTEVAKGCTVQVAPKKARFWTAATDGSKALYTVEQGSTERGSLFAYDADSNSSTLIAEQVLGLLGASDDVSRVYLVSLKALAAGGEEGMPNLYAYERGTFRFIAPLAAADVRPQEKIIEGERQGALSPLSAEPFRHTSLVTPDGRHVVFMSTAALKGYDNTDANSGEADAEVYRYDAVAGTLDCVSCNPSGSRPIGRELEIKQAGANLWGSAQIARANSQLYAPRVISDDGSRVFFESFEALLRADVNGKADVYEWEAPGAGNCTITAPAYSPPNGGCLSLISSGQGSRDSSFVDASSGGSDVFFSTIASLVPQDEELVDIYDARVNGGFPKPPTPVAPCSGEACQPPASSPAESTPASSVFVGPKNQKQRIKKKQHKRQHKKRHIKKKQHKKRHIRGTRNHGQQGRVR